MSTSDLQRIKAKLEGLLPTLEAFHHELDESLQAEDGRDERDKTVTPEDIACLRRALESLIHLNDALRWIGVPAQFTPPWRMAL